jgi:hypothetical protein
MAMGDGWSKQASGSWVWRTLTECRRPIIGLLPLPWWWSTSFATLRVDSISAASFAAAYLFMGRSVAGQSRRSQVVDPSLCEATMPVYSDILLWEHARSCIQAGFADGPILIAPGFSHEIENTFISADSLHPTLHLLHRCNHGDTFLSYDQRCLPSRL